jgi:tungstate transport system substrate-binding protein
MLISHGAGDSFPSAAFTKSTFRNSSQQTKKEDGMPNKKTYLVKGLLVLVFSVCLTLPLFADDQCKAVYGKGTHTFRLATGSPGELGMLEVIADAFNSKNDTRLCWKKAGSGKSLQLLKEKKVDMVMVHAPAAEKQAVAEGWAIKRKLIGSNEFYIVGPKDDPADIAKVKTAAEAFANIAKAEAKFFSRGDNSGTHKKELAVWKNAGVKPGGDWYIVTKTFMMATLKQANEQNGYFMTDSSTWIAARKEMDQIKVLFRGDPFLINTYHALCQPEGATAGQPYAAKFIDFVVSEEGQALIRDFGAEEHGEGLYNDAAYAKQYDH